MKRYTRPIIVLGVAGLLMFALWLLVCIQTPVYADGAIIKVPDDYTTIQAAIDAAVPGDTILVAQGTYHENLSITEGITLSGGWDESFTTLSPFKSYIDGQGLGRVISITCATSDTVVTVDGFRIMNGDASGLGAPLMPEYSSSETHSEKSGIPSTTIKESDSRSPSEQAAELRIRLADLADRGLYPGGQDAYETMLTRLEWHTTRAEEAKSRAELQPEMELSTSGPDAGGGVYSFNASLHLLNSIVEFNVASMENEGHGGGIYVSQAAPSGTLIVDNLVQYNTASMYAEGNGGGLQVYQSPGVIIEGNKFMDNAGSSGGQYGVGGGLYVDDSGGVQVKDNRIERNTAHAGWNCPGRGGGGVGGGAYIRLSDDAVVTDNVFQDNLAAVHCGSHTGGLYVYLSNNLQIIGNEVIGNWGVLYQVYNVDFGGGIGIDTTENATVVDNIVRGNATSITAPHDDELLAFGGGIYGFSLFNSQITFNEIEANTVSFQSGGYGGGAFLSATEDLKIVGNNFSENLGSFLTEGWGGGVDLDNTVNTMVEYNHFWDNRGSVEHIGYGGALSTRSMGPHSIDTTINANLFLDNQASAYPDFPSFGGAVAIVTHGFTFTNNVVAGNEASQGGGLWLGLAENGEVINNTFSGNSGAAVLNLDWETPITLTNNIIVSHTVGISVGEGASAIIRYTLWDGNGINIAGSGAISHTHPVTGTPAFANPADDDYHLTISSAARDAGDPEGVPPAPEQDYDGVTRPQGPGVDLGAYEWRGAWRYLPTIFSRYRPHHGWVVGGSVGDGYGVILHTTDGGRTWIRQGGPGKIPDMDMECVAAIDAQNAWVVGGDYESGVILRTRDGGETWEQQNIPEDAQGKEINGIYALDGDTAWAVGTVGMILHTTDGGTTWEIQGQGEIPDVPYNGVYASDRRHVWVIGDPQHPDDKFSTVIRSGNGGKLWKDVHYSLEREPPQNQLIMVHGVDADTVWVVGPQQVSHTADGGKTWIDQFNPDMGASDHFNGVFAVDRETIWLARDYGGIFLSTDGGTNFQLQDTPHGAQGYHFMRISAIDRQTAWTSAFTSGATPFRGLVLHTSDGGKNWKMQQLPVDTMWMWVSFVR